MRTGCTVYYLWSKQEACWPDSSTIYNWLSCHRPFIYQKSVQTLLKITHLAKIKIRSSWSRTLFRITQLAYRKSCLVIICPNSHKKFTKIKIRSSWSQFEHCSESLIWPLGSYTCSLFAPFHMKSWPKVKLGKVIMCPYLGLSTLIWPQYTMLVQI